MKTPVGEWKRRVVVKIKTILSLMFYFYDNYSFYKDNNVSIIICELKYFKEPTENFRFSNTAKERC